MPSPNSTRVELAVYVAPEHHADFMAALARSDDNCLLLDIEKTIGVHIDRERNGAHGTRPALFAPITALPDYGEGVAEVYEEGVS